MCARIALAGLSGRLPALVVSRFPKGRDDFVINLLIGLIPWAPLDGKNKLAPRSDPREKRLVTPERSGSESRQEGISLLYRSDRCNLGVEVCSSVDSPSIQEVSD